MITGKSLNVGLISFTLKMWSIVYAILQVMKKTHYYLVDTSVIIPGAAVTELQFNIIKEEPFIVHSLEVRPVIVFLNLL